MKSTICRVVYFARVGAWSLSARETSTEVAVGPQVTDRGSSGYGCWGDCDGDGYADLSISRYAGAEVIYRNNGDGDFVTTLVGVVEPYVSCVTADDDRDGWLVVPQEHR